MDSAQSCSHLSRIAGSLANEGLLTSQPATAHLDPPLVLRNVQAQALCSDMIVEEPGWGAHIHAANPKGEAGALVPLLGKPDRTLSTEHR
ncbi:MAG: hypothetical protein ACI9W2_004429 [Gammaproteobacteria bacterium]|jgi:hypothetical protein